MCCWTNENIFCSFWMECYKSLPLQPVTRLPPCHVASVHLVSDQVFYRNHWSQLKCFRSHMMLQTHPCSVQANGSSKATPTSNAFVPEAEMSELDTNQKDWVSLEKTRKMWEVCFGGLISILGQADSCSVWIGHPGHHITFPMGLVELAALPSMCFTFTDDITVRVTNLVPLLLLSSRRTGRCHDHKVCVLQSV